MGANDGIARSLATRDRLDYLPLALIMSPAKGVKEEGNQTHAGILNDLADIDVDISIAYLPEHTCTFQTNILNA